MSFLKFLDALRVSESYQSVWLFAESSYKIFDFAKKRVYRLTKASDVVKSKEQVKNTSGKKRKSNASVEAGNRGLISNIWLYLAFSDFSCYMLINGPENQLLVQRRLVLALFLKKF